MTLTDLQARVLGSLIEKEITTPENYPLSLNALRNACNQSSSRDPVMTLDEDEVRQAVHVLQDMGLADSTQDGRVPKFEHRVRDRMQLRRDETAVLCLLLLRGPQTPGELRTRSERLFPFDDPAQVMSTLQRLAGREAEPLTAQLARQPGSRESRWSQLLSSPIETRPAEAGPAPRATLPAEGGLAEQLEELRREVRQLRQRLDRFEGIA